MSSPGRQSRGTRGRATFCSWLSAPTWSTTRPLNATPTSRRRLAGRTLAKTHKPAWFLVLYSLQNFLSILSARSQKVAASPTLHTSTTSTSRSVDTALKLTTACLAPALPSHLSHNFSNTISQPYQLTFLESHSSATLPLHIRSLDALPDALWQRTRR